MRAFDLYAERFYRQDPLSEEEMREFFRVASPAVYANARRHENAVRQRVQEALLEYAKVAQVTTALDYGCGNGDDALALSHLGIKTTLADLEGPTFNFAQWRMMRLGRGIPQAISLEQGLQAIAGKKWELTVCLDVLPYVFDIHAALDALCQSADRLFISARTLLGFESLGVLENQWIVCDGHLEIALLNRGFEPVVGYGPYAWRRS